jgi:hypothetical protein
MGYRVVLSSIGLSVGRFSALPPYLQNSTGNVLQYIRSRLKIGSEKNKAKASKKRIVYLRYHRSASMLFSFWQIQSLGTVYAKIGKVNTTLFNVKVGTVKRKEYNTPSLQGHDTLRIRTIFDGNQEPIVLFCEIFLKTM